MKKKKKKKINVANPGRKYDSKIKCFSIILSFTLFYYVLILLCLSFDFSGYVILNIIFYIFQKGKYTIIVLIQLFFLTNL